jgi:hypothetical protein
MNQIRFKTPSDMSYEELNRLSGPSNAGQPEAVAWTYYDVREIGTTQQQVNFFNSVPATLALGNIQQANGFPEGEYFEIHYIGLELLQDDPHGTDFAEDLLSICYNNGSVLLLTISNKQYGQWPVAHIGAPNVPTISPIAAAVIQAQFGGPAIGVWLNGSIIIPPKQAFSFALIGDGSKALTDDRRLRLSMIGNLYRLVR